MTVQMSLEVAGLNELANGIARAPERLEVEIHRAMQQSTFLAEAEIKTLTPRKTGRLFSAWRTEIRNAGLETVGVVGNHVRYATFVELGRGPIVANHLTKSGKHGFLRFRINGQVISRRSVGPAAGRFMAKRGLAAARPGIYRIFRNAAKRVADSIKGS